MEQHWARKRVTEWPHYHEGPRDITVLLLTNRQQKLLHLQGQCYWTCPYCYEEATKYIEGRNLRNVSVSD